MKHAASDSIIEGITYPFSVLHLEIQREKSSIKGV